MSAALRPSIPHAGWMAVGMWVGCLAAERASWAAWGGESPGAGLVVAALAAVGLAAGASRVSVLRTVVVLVAFGAVGGVCASGLQGLAWHREAARVVDCGAREWTGIVEADPTPGSYGTVVRVRLTGAPLPSARVRVGWPEGQEVPELGCTVRFSAILKPLPPGEPWARRTARGGACATGSAWRGEVGAWRSGMLGRLLAWRAGALERMHGVPGIGGDLLEGIVLGDRRRLLGTATDEEFRILGLSHLVAVSGSHLALACGAVALVGRALGMTRRPLVLATTAAGASYAVVTGMPYSALRSLLMLAVGGGAVLAGRRPDGLSALSCSVVAVLTIEPWSVFDLGFQLSVLAVGGLLLFGGLATEWAVTGVRGPGRLVAGTLALTCVAQVLTVPVVASTFGMVSVLAPAANAYAAPLVSAAMFLGLAGALAGSVVPAAGNLLAAAGGAILGATAWLSHHAAQLPGAAVAVGAGPLLIAAPVAGAVGVWVWWPRPASTAVARRVTAVVIGVCAALAIGPAPARQSSVVVLDVGQGDAVLVRDSGRTMLVDVGPDETVLRRALSRNGVRRIDALVMTHAHDDHTGGAAGLSGITTVGWVGVPGVGPSCVSEDAVWLGPDTPVKSLAAGDSWLVGQMRVVVLWPPAEPGEELETNDTSVVLHLSVGELDVVLTGDAEAAAQAGMIEDGALSPIEVLKVPHHGSSNGLTAEALEMWDPDVALVSVGEGNRFNHPSASTISMLKEHAVVIMRTDHSGDLTVRPAGPGYRVTGSRRGEKPTVRARIGRTRALACADAPSYRHTVGSRSCGGHEHRGSEAGLPHLRRRGVAAGARAPPFASARRRGSRPRLQLRHVRRRLGRRYRRCRGRQYAAVRL